MTPEYGFGMLLVGLIGICIGAVAGFYIINKVEDGKNKEKDNDSIAPNMPLNFGMCLLYSPSPNKCLRIVKAVP